MSDTVPADGNFFGPNGYAFPQKTYGPDPGQCWGDCNGSSSEKVDYWHHLDKETDTTEEFHE